MGIPSRDARTHGWVDPSAIGPGLKLDELGRVVPDLSPETALYVNSENQIDLLTGHGLEQSKGSPITLRSKLQDPVPLVEHAMDVSARAYTALHAEIAALAVAPPTAHATSHEDGGTDEIDVTGLSGLLADAQTPLAHVHAEADVTGLVADLAAKVPTTRTVTAGTALTGGGALSSNITLNVSLGNTAAQACAGDDARLAMRTSGYQGFLHDGSIYTSRRLFNCETCVGLAAFGTMTQDRWYIIPAVAPDEIDVPTLTGLGVEITTAAAGFLYIAVWSSSNGYPDAYLAGTAKINSGSTGFGEDTGVSQAFTPGQKIWVGVACDAAGVAIRGVSVNAQAACLGRGAAGATNHLGGFYYDGAADTPPDPFPAPTGQLVGVATPAIHGFWG